MNTKKSILIIIIITATVLTLGIAAFSSLTGKVRINDSSSSLSAHETVDKEKSFRIDEIQKINVNTVSENITFIASEREEIKVVFHGNTSNSKLAPKLKALQSDTVLDLKIEYPKNPFRVFNLVQNFHLDIYIPEDYKGNVDVLTVSADISMPVLNLNSLSCNTISGDFSAEFINSKDVVFNTTSGNFKFDVLCDSLSFNSISGDLISYNLSTNKSKFHSTSGEMKINSFAGDLDFSSTSGNLQISYDTFNNDINIKTTSGDIKIGLPRNAQFYLNFKSTSGNVKTDFPITVTESSKNSLVGTVGSDENSISGTSVSGNLQIFR